MASLAAAVSPKMPFSLPFPRAAPSAATAPSTRLHSTPILSLQHTCINTPLSNSNSRLSSAISSEKPAGVRFAGVGAATPGGAGVQATSGGNLTEKLAESIKEAEKACAEDSAAECAASWDAVEEISAAVSDKREQAKQESDPLESFCKENPETDECRVYED